MHEGNQLFSPFWKKDPSFFNNCWCFCFSSLCAFTLPWIKKRPLHLWSVTCPSSCGPGIHDEEWCSDEMFQKSWHTEGIWAQTYILDLSHILTLAQLWLGTRLSALPQCLWTSTPNPLPPFFLPPMPSSVRGKEKKYVSSLKPYWLHGHGEAVWNVSSAGSSSNYPCWEAVPWLNNLPSQNGWE